MQYRKTAWLALALCVLSLPVWADSAWIQPVAPGWQVRALLTTGERAADGYAMAGIPDGLGALAGPDGVMTVLMNHEIAAGKGAVRAHGANGAFVSRWELDIEKLQVKTGRDLVRQTVPPGLVFNRLCSADLAPVSGLFDAASGKGYDGRLFMNGEEDKTGGHAYAHGLDGTSYQLADFGSIAWENVLVRPGGGESSVVIGLDDNHDGLLLVYLGEKRHQGNPVERAGLTGGKLYSLKVEGGRFRLVELPGAAGLDYKALKALAIDAGVTRFARPEDGAWDARDPRHFWFATTDRIGGDSRLWHLTFDDVAASQQGGRIETALRARDVGAEMFDNLTLDESGQLLIQEDPGNHPRLAAIWRFDPASGAASRVAEADPQRFRAGGQAFLTEDEEHSGIIEVTPLLKAASWFDPGRRYYLGTTQAHLPHPENGLEEYGQLWLLSGPR